jgi:hypothetical protein
MQSGDAYLFPADVLWRVAYERATARTSLEDIMAVGTENDVNVTLFARRPNRDSDFLCLQAYITYCTESVHIDISTTTTITHALPLIMDLACPTKAQI